MPDLTRRRARHFRRSAVFKLTGTWIAACALTYGLPLATLNAKDFKDFKDFAEHEGLSLIIR